MAKVKKITADKTTKRVEYAEVLSYDIQAYDFDNIYPQRCLDILNDSGTGVLCIDMTTRFLLGAGLNNKPFSQMVVNSDGLTVEKLRHKISDSIAKWKAVALHFNYDANGNKTEVRFVPFEYCRLTLEDTEKYPNMIAVYDDWDTQKEKKIEAGKIQYIHKYNPRAVLEQVNEIGDEKTPLAEKFAEYKGQIWYWSREGDSMYPKASFDAVLEDMITEAQTKKFKANTSARNFLASHIVTTGKGEAPQDVESGDYDGNRYTEDNAFGEELAKFQGGEGAGAILHVELEYEGESLQMHKVELQNYDGLFEFTEGSAQGAIYRNFLIPPVLILQTAGKLGTSTEIQDAKDYFNSITEPWRDVISYILEETCKGFAKELNASRDYQINPLKSNKPIPKEYAEHFTEEEIRQSLGYPGKKPESNER